MTFRMKGPSLLKMVSKLKDLRGTKEKGPKVDLTKKPVGPTADVKKDEDYEVGGVTLDPGYEDPIKIQKDQREGIVPGSQTFKNK